MRLPFVWLYAIVNVSTLSKSVLHPILESYMTYEIRTVVSKFGLACARRCKPCQCKKNKNATPVRVDAGIADTSPAPHKTEARVVDSLASI